MKNQVTKPRPGVQLDPNLNNMHNGINSENKQEKRRSQRRPDVEEA